MNRRNLLLTLIFTVLLALAACTPVPTPDPLPTPEEEATTAVAEEEAPAEEASSTEEEATTGTDTDSEPADDSATEPAEVPEVAPPPTQEEIDALLADLEVELVEEGDGSQPEPGDIVVTDIIITTEDGEEVFNSYELGEPVRFPYGVDVMFPVGLDTAVGQMSVGETIRITLPPAIGFGPDGSGLVPPGSTVIMEVELVSIPEIELIVEEEGDGPTAEFGDLVTVHYTGTLEDGTEFDSSRDREPFQLILGAGQVIPGWEIGLEGLTEGTTARFIIPPDLAYGSTERPGIPANSTLVFDIEVVTVTKAPTESSNE